MFWSLAERSRDRNLYMRPCWALLLVSAIAAREEDFQLCADAADAGLLLLQTPDLKVQAIEVPVRPNAANISSESLLIKEVDELISNVESAFASWMARWPNAAAALNHLRSQTQMLLHPDVEEEFTLSGDVSDFPMPINATDGMVTITVKKKRSIDTVVHTIRAILIALVALALVALAGTMSGLSLGLLSIRITDLEAFARSEDPEHQEFGRSFLHVVSDKHLLLVTLLLANTMATETLPLVLNVEMNAVASAIVGILSLLVGGEILPQALFSVVSLNTLSHFLPFVQVLLWISWPIARPFATVLDLMFNRGGMNPFEMPRQALLALMRVQQEKGVLSEQEAQILDGAMGLAGKKAGACLTRIEDVHSLPEDAMLDVKNMEYLRQQSRSRILVHSADDRRRLVSVLICKSMLGLQSKDGYSIKELARDELLHVSEDDSLADVLAKMQEDGSMRMAVVYDRSVKIVDDSRPDAPALGVITMTDVVQQLLLSENKDGTARSSQRRPSVTRTRSFTDFVLLTSRNQ